MKKPNELFLQIQNFQKMEGLCTITAREKFIEAYSQLLKDICYDEPFDREDFDCWIMALMGEAEIRLKDHLAQKTKSEEGDQNGKTSKN